MTVTYASRQGRLVLLATVLGSGIAFLDGTVVNVALPAIGRGLGIRLEGLQWTVDSYLLTLTAFLLPGGALGDRLGRKRVFAAGLLLFGVTSATCGMAPTGTALAVARAVQGLAAALLVPGSLSLLRTTFTAGDQDRAVGAWAGLSGVAAALGPLAGGWLADAFSWRAIFFVNVPLVIAAVGVTLRHVPESRDPAVAKADLAGGVLAAAGLGGVAWALIERTGGARPLALAAGVATLAAFLATEARRASPMLPLGLFRSRAFTVVNLVTLAVYFALSGAFFLVVLQLQSGLGWSPVAAGAALLPVTLLMLLLSPLAGRLLPRLGARPFLTAGPLVVALALVLLGQVAPGARWALDVLPGAVLLGLGLGLTVAPLTSTALGAVPLAMAGVASGVNNAVARLAGLLAVALLPVAGGIDARGLARGDFSSGYARALTVAAALAAAGSLLAAIALPLGAATYGPVKKAR